MQCISGQIESSTAIPVAVIARVDEVSWLYCQGRVEEAEKQVVHLTAEVAAAKKAQEKLASESNLNTKKASKAMEELKQHLAAAEKDASHSKSALAEVAGNGSMCLVCY